MHYEKDSTVSRIVVVVGYIISCRDQSDNKKLFQKLNSVSFLELLGRWEITESKVNLVPQILLPRVFFFFLRNTQTKYRSRARYL